MSPSWGHSFLGMTPHAHGFPQRLQPALVAVNWSHWCQEGFPKVILSRWQEPASCLNKVPDLPLQGPCRGSELPLGDLICRTSCPQVCRNAQNQLCSCKMLLLGDWRNRNQRLGSAVIRRSRTGVWSFDTEKETTALFTSPSLNGSICLSKRALPVSTAACLQIREKPTRSVPGPKPGHARCTRAAWRFHRCGFLSRVLVLRGRVSVSECLRYFQVAASLNLRLTAGLESSYLPGIWSSRSVCAGPGVSEPGARCLEAAFSSSPTSGD